MENNLRLLYDEAVGYATPDQKLQLKRIKASLNNAIAPSEYTYWTDELTKYSLEIVEKGTKRVI